MTEYNTDLNNISLDNLQSAINGYNSEYVASFKVNKTGDSYTLTEGESNTVETYCVGTLREVAYYWQGWVAGQLHGLPSQDEDDGI